MTAEEAAADNVPAGYTGAVLEMTTDTYQMDIVLDFSAQKLTKQNRRHIFQGLRLLYGER